MNSPTRSLFSPTASRISGIIPETSVVSPRSISSRSELESNIHALQNEQERVQKKTFTKWVNIYLSMHEPSYFINDLFADLKDGTRLIGLLEVLSGQTIPMEKGTTRAHCISNVSNALKYLENRKIKLVNIRPPDIVDGKPTIILGLIWMLILCYQIEDSSMFDEDSKDHRSKAKEALLEWVRKKTSGIISGLDVRDFTSSWRDGLAFNALIHSLRPDLIDLRRVERMDTHQRLEYAFDIAEKQLGIPRLIDAEDVDVTRPDEKSIMTYLAQFSRRFPDLPFGSINKEHGELLRWLADARQRLTAVIEAPIIDIQTEYKEFVKQTKEFVEKQKQWKAFERKESKSPHFPGEKLRELKELFDDITARMNQWRHKLDSHLPGDLRQIAEWIYRAEEVLARGIPFNPLESTAEENFHRFKQLSDEYAAIFTDKEITSSKFQRLKRDPSIVNQQVSIEQLTNLDERLQIIMTTSDERTRLFDFEQTHWQIQDYLNQLEDLAKILNKKQGNLEETEERFRLYRKRIDQEKIFSHLENLLSEATRKSQSYTQLTKKDDRMAKEFATFCDTTRKQLKSLTTDMKSQEHLLQETFEQWRVYHSLNDQLENWFNEGRQISHRSPDEQMKYFSGLERWKESHRKLCQSLEYLISVCNDALSQQLGQRLLFINRQWQEMLDQCNNVKHQESIKKKREEFYSVRTKTLETLEAIHREIQESFPCTIKALKEQENRLFKAQSSLKLLQETVQALNVLCENIAKESGDEQIGDEMRSALENCFDKLRRIEQFLPLTLQRNKILLGYVQKFDDQTEEVYQWLNEGKQLISRYSIQVPMRRIEEFLEQNRNYSSQIDSYRATIDALGRLIETMKRANENTAPLNYAPLEEQYRQLNSTFEQIREQTNLWDQQFHQHLQLWQEFHQRQKALEQWIDQAQMIVNEKNEDFVYLIHKHEKFFQNLDDEILRAFIKSGSELLHIRDAMEQKDIRYLMTTLESKWNTIVCYAPIRLLRLHYGRIEAIIVKELKLAEEELNEELKQLERQRDTTEILRRHNERFQSNNFQPTIQDHIEHLHTYANDIRIKERSQTLLKPDDEQYDQRTSKLSEYWKRTQSKINNVRQKLQTIPKKWQEFEEKFQQVENWMVTIEKSIGQTKNTDVPLEQYQPIVATFRNHVEHTDTMSNHVSSLATILEDLIEQGATDEPGRYHQRLDTLVSRYRQLLVAISETSKQCAVIIPAKLIHENSTKLVQTLNTITHMSNACRDLNDVRLAVQNQTQICDHLKELSQQVHELLTHGNELLRQSMVPKYVQQDLQNLQRVYNDKVQSGQDILGKLKRLYELWERFDANQRRYRQQTDRFDQEFSQIQSNRTTISSFQQAIDQCKHLRTSYVESKSIVDETAQLLQTITTNNFLPYENLQILKRDFEQIQEEFLEHLRTLDELIQELTRNNEQWIHFNDELKRLETFFHQISSSLETKSFIEKPVEEKEQLLERIRLELVNHLNTLSSLYADGSQMESLRYRPKDLQNVLNRLKQLRILADNTSTKVMRQEEQTAECRTHVQTSQQYLRQLQPWIEQSEAYLQKRFQQTGATNVNEAKQVFDKHKEFLDERRRMLTIYENLLNEEVNIAYQYDLKAAIKTVTTRWNDLIRRSDEFTTISDDQYRIWSLFDAEFISFRDQILFQLEQRIHSTSAIEVEKFLDLNRIHATLNDFKTLEETMNNHQTHYNRLQKLFNDLKPFTSTDGQRIVQEEQKSLEKRWQQLHRLLTEKLRESERLYESRKSFHQRFEQFENHVRNFVEQIEANGQIQTNSSTQTLQHLQQIQREYQTTQTLLTTVGHELAELEVAGLPKLELQPIHHSYEALRQRLANYELILQKRLDLLKRFDEHLRRSNDIRSKLQQIHDDLQTRPTFKLNDIDQLKSQLERFKNDLRTILSESSLLDRLMEESNTIIVDSTSNRTLFFVIESRSIQNLLDTIENKLIQRQTQTRELNQLIDEFTQSHNNLLQRINALSHKLRSTRLSGYAIRDIEDLMMIIKHLQDEIEQDLDPLYKQFLAKSLQMAENEGDDDDDDGDLTVAKMKIEWDRLNTEVNERLYVLQRSHTLYNEIQLLRQRIEQTLDSVDQIFISHVTSFTEMKNHLNKLKQIDLEQRKSAEHDMAICQKRREEFILLLQSWYEMTWANFLNLSDLQSRLDESFQFRLHDQIKRTETICHYLQTIDKLRTDFETKFNALDEFHGKLKENFDANRYLEILQAQRPTLARLFDQFTDQFQRLKSHCPQEQFIDFDEIYREMKERLAQLDQQIRQLIANEEEIHNLSLRLLARIEQLNPSLSQYIEQMETYEKFFKMADTMENFVDLHQNLRQVQNEFSTNFSPKFVELNEEIHRYTNEHFRQESTDLSTNLMTMINRTRLFEQELNRLIERIDERIESETNTSVETYRKFMENLRIKLTRIRDDHRLTIEGKQRLIHEISHALSSGHVYVNQAIGNIKMTRNLFNHEYNVNEIDEECQVIDDEWIEFISDFDDQKHAVERLVQQFVQLELEIERLSQLLKEKEQQFQSMIANQSTLELKRQKLEDIQDLIEILNQQNDRRTELKQLESKISIVSLIQNANQCAEKRQQLLAHAQDALVQVTEAIEVHQQFHFLTDRFHQWMNDVENRLDEHMQTDGIKSHYAVEEHHRSIEKLIEENVDGESLLSSLDDYLEQVLKTTSIEGRTQLKSTLGEYQTRWTNYHLKQKQLKQLLHQIKLDRLEFDENLKEILQWIDEHREKFHQLIVNLGLHEENRKRFYQLKSFLNESNLKQKIVRSLNEKSLDDEQIERVQNELIRFHDELRSKIHFLEEFLRTQLAIEDQKQSLMEKFKFLMDRLSLCTKTDCDFETLQSRLRKIEEYQDELNELEKEFQQSYDQYHSILEKFLNPTVKLNYQKNFEQMHLVIDNGKKTIERAILELKHLCDVWKDYEDLNEKFLFWLNQTEIQSAAFHHDDDQQTLEYFTHLCQIIADQDRQLKQLEDLESAITDFDWSRQAHNTTILRQRLIVLLGQCNSQLERAQQLVQFNQQWKKTFDTVDRTFQTYGQQLFDIRQEQNSLVPLDKIQNLQQFRIQCEQHLKELEMLATTASTFLPSNRKESIRTQLRGFKIHLNELNELFSNIQQDLRSRSQACEVVQTCLDELEPFLDSLPTQSNPNEILSLTLIKSLKNQLDQFEMKSKRLRTIDPFLSHCSTELMRAFESINNRFQLSRKELETRIRENEFYFARQQELDVLLVDLDRHLTHLLNNYQTFETISKENRRDFDLKLDKHQILFQSIKEFDQRVIDIRKKVYEAGLRSPLQESIEKRLNQLERNSTLLQEKSMQTFTAINTIKFDCEKLLQEMKQINDWLKITEQQLNRYLPIHLSTAEEKNEAAKKMLEKLDEFAVEEVQREQLKQRAQSLFQILDDATLQAHLDDLDRTFSNLKQLVHQRYELLNRTGHHHADYDHRFQNLSMNFDNLQTTFHQIRQGENHGDILHQLQLFKVELNEFEEEFYRLISINEQIVSETSIEGGEQLKLKLKQLQSKWRNFSSDLLSFEERLAQEDEEQRALLKEQENIEQTLTNIQQQLKYFDREYFHSSVNPDQVRQRLQQMNTTLNQVEKSQSQFFSPSSSTDSSLTERAQQLSSFHEQLKSSTQKKLEQLVQIEKYSNEILSFQQTFHTVVETCSRRLQTYESDTSKNETHLKGYRTTFEAHRTRFNELIVKCKDFQNQMENESISKDFLQIVTEKLEQILVDAEQWTKKLSQTESNCQRLERIVDEQNQLVEQIRQRFNEIEEKLDGFQWKQSIDEKFLQKEELKRLRSECLEYDEQLQQIEQRFHVEQIEGSSSLSIIEETKQKSSEIIRNLETLLQSGDQIIDHQTRFDQTYNEIRKSMESLHEKFQSSLEVDSGVAELSALLSECDSLRDRLDLMNSTYNSIDTQLRSRRRSSISSQFLTSSSSVHNHTMKAMLQQTKDEYDRLVQTLRSSKQTIESKQQRLHTLNQQLNDLQHEYEQLLNQTKISTDKDDQYEYKDECQRKRFLIQDIEPKLNRLQTISSEANDFNDLQLANHAKRLSSHFEHLRRDLSNQLEENERRCDLLQRLTNDCLVLQQSLQTIQNQLSPISDTYGDKEYLDEKLKKLTEIKNLYRNISPTLQEVEQLVNQASMIVGPQGKHHIRREWERIQMKSHQINTTILKIEQQLQNCISDWLTFSKENEQLSTELIEFDSSLKSLNIRLPNDGQSPVETVRTMKTNFDFLESKFYSLQRFASDLSQRTQEMDFLEDFQQFQILLQRLKLTLKDLLRKTSDNQTKYNHYAEQMKIYEDLLRLNEEKLDEIHREIDRWNQSTIAMKTLQGTSRELRTFLDEQPNLQRQSNVINELTENLIDLVENSQFFRQRSLTLNNRQVNLFQRATTFEHQLDHLTQRIDQIEEQITKINDLHLHIERKVQQVKEFPLTLNVNERQERWILAQTIVDNLNETDLDLRALDDTLAHLQPKINEFQQLSEQLRRNHQSLNEQSETLENQCRSEYNALKQWDEHQQHFDRIVHSIRKQLDIAHVFTNLHQFNEFLANFTSNFHQIDQLKEFLHQAKPLIDIFDRSSQFSLIHTFEQYQSHWKDLRERLEKKHSALENLREETSKLNEDWDQHMKKSTLILNHFTEIEKDSTRTSKEKLDLFKTDELKTLTSFNTILEKHLSSVRDMTIYLTNEPIFQHQIAQCIETQEKLHGQFNLIVDHLEQLASRFNHSLNENVHLEKRLTGILRDLEKCSTLTGDQFTHHTRQYLQDHQNVQRAILLDLQKISDENLLISSDVKSFAALEERAEHLKSLHNKIEQKIQHLRERVNISLSINDKIDDNIRQIKRKLILYQGDLKRLKQEIPNSVSDKRIRAELAVTIFTDLELMNTTIEQLISDAEQERETSMENLRALKELKIEHEQMFNEFKEQVHRNNLMFNEHFNYGESVRTLRSFLADMNSELCHCDKQPISNIEQTKKFLESKMKRFHFYKSEYEQLKSILERIQQSTGVDGQQKLIDEDHYLFDAFQSLEILLNRLQIDCQEKQRVWIEFQLRFDTIRSSYRQVMEINSIDLDQLKDVENELRLIEEQFDALNRIRSEHFTNENLFYFDSSLEQDLAQFQRELRGKSREIHQQIEHLTEEQRKAERLKFLMKTFEDQLNVHHRNVQEISHQRQIDDKTTFDRLGSSIDELEQIQRALKETTKNLQQLPNDSSLKERCETLRNEINEEILQFNRLSNEWKSFNQLTRNYEDLNEQINECLVEIDEHFDDRSRLLTPEIDQRRSSTDQFVRLNLFLIQLDEQLNLLEHHRSISSIYLRQRFEQIENDFRTLKQEIQSMIEKETQTISIQFQLDQLIETIEKEFDRRPIFSRILTKETLTNYQLSSTNYFQSVDENLKEFENTLNHFEHRQYQHRFEQFRERYEQMKLHHQSHFEHLQQGAVQVLRNQPVTHS